MSNSSFTVDERTCAKCKTSLANAPAKRTVCNDCATKHGVCRICGTKSKEPECWSCAAADDVDYDVDKDKQKIPLTTTSSTKFEKEENVRTCAGCDEDLSDDDDGELCDNCWSKTTRCAICQHWCWQNDEDFLCSGCAEDASPAKCAWCGESRAVYQKLCYYCWYEGIAACRFCRDINYLNARDECPKCSGNVVTTVVTNNKKDENLKQDLVKSCNNNNSSSSSDYESKEKSPSKAKRTTIVIDGHGDWQKKYGYVDIPQDCTFTILGPFGSLLGFDAAVCAERLLKDQPNLDLWAKKLREDRLIGQDYQYHQQKQRHVLARDYVYPLMLFDGSAGKFSDKQIATEKNIDVKPGVIPNYHITLDKKVDAMQPGEGLILADRTKLYLMRENGKEEMDLKELLSLGVKLTNTPCDFIYSACAGDSEESYANWQGIEHWAGLNVRTCLLYGASEEFMDDYTSGDGTIKWDKDTMILFYKDFGSFLRKEVVASIYEACEKEDSAYKANELQKKFGGNLFPEDLTALADHMSVTIFLHDAELGYTQENDPVTFECFGDGETHIHVLWEHTSASKTQYLYRVEPKGEK